jgi:hypothetical protein
MKTCTSLGLAALAAVALTLPAMAATAPAAMIPCPIEIRSLQVSPSVVNTDRGRNPGADYVTFRDARTVAATHVTFAFYGNGKRGFIKSAVSKGLFSPGIDILKHFPDTSIFLITSVVVSKADFADGRVCHNRNNSGAVFSRRKHTKST